MCYNSFKDNILLPARLSLIHIWGIREEVGIILAPQDGRVIHFERRDEIHDFYTVSIQLKIPDRIKIVNFIPAFEMDNPSILRRQYNTCLLYTSLRIFAMRHMNPL